MPDRTWLVKSRAIREVVVASDPRLVILMGNASAALLNVAMAVINGVNHHWLWMVVSVSAVLVSSAAFGWAFHQRYMRHSKEEQSSSPNQQPTSGTSQNLAQSLSLSLASGGIVGVKSGLFSQNSSPSESENQFPPRQPRAVPVVGFRSWNIDPHHRVGIGPGWRLASYNRQYGRWEPGQNKATCQRQDVYFGLLSSSERPPRHDVPAADCTCGFYVLTDFDKVPFVTEEMRVGSNGEVVERRPLRMMVGAVVGWGRVIQHADEGWRAEKVQLIALLDCKVSEEHLRVTREVADSYGVPVLGRTALELLAKEYGDRLTDLEQPSGKAALEAHNEV